MYQEYNAAAVEQVNSLLDEIGLRSSRDRLVVIGGSALAVWGVKPLHNADLDIAITDDLRRGIKNQTNWWEADLTPRQLDYHPKIANGVTAIMPPFGKEYPVTADELVAEGIPCGEAGYMYSPLWRILETKLALSDAPAESPRQSARCEKHWNDVMLITHFALTQIKA